MSDSENNLAAAPDAFPGAEDGWTDRAERFRPPFVEQFAGIIRSGPALGGGADYADARYFIDRAIPAPVSTSTNLLSAKVETLAGVRQTVTATNLAETAHATHLMPAGAVVQVFALYARGGGAKAYIFNQSPMLSAVVQITSVAASGEYNGKIVGGAATASGATAFTMPAGMSVPAADNALVLNLEEAGESGHRLADGSYAVGVVRGTTSDSPPRSIVVIRGGLGRTDSPTTLGGSSEGTESADTATWSKASDGAPVNVYVVGRVVYNPTGDQTLYSFVRMLSFDARGLLINISAETRVTVDVTEACS